ncbi:MAG: 2-amino-4-hydroxy-6-hydroxymethyldihydropteridine diphosphokinase [Novosphingobium sp.]
MAGSRKTYEYVIALGSNRRHGRYGAPAKVLRAALAALDVAAASPIVASQPLGPSRRRYANAAALLRTHEQPGDLLARLKTLERRFGRRCGGQRWGARVLDLDIVLWSGGAWASKGLIVPHTAFRERLFVLTPALAIAPRWRDPVTELTMRQLHARLTRPLPLPR